MSKSVITIQKNKDSNKKIVALTAYDYTTAKLLEEAGVDIILVGDSLAMVALGQKNTLSVTMEEMLHHTRAVSKGAPRTLIVADMPFMSYQTDKTEALRNAGRFIKEADAQAIKLEGASDNILEVVKSLTQMGIPVMGHLGFTPQFINSFGGYFVQAKSADNAQLLLQQAIALQNHGAFSVVLEMVPASVGKLVTENLTIPTIGIGAGPYCDGQILVTDDLLGKYTDFTPSFVRRYANVGEISRNAFMQYCQDVRNSNFPDEKAESFSIDENEDAKINLIKS